MDEIYNQGWVDALEAIMSLIDEKEVKDLNHLRMTCDTYIKAHKK